eukprot:SAG11_NODE_32907_length_280_cov_0.574586_1_plen_35_part_10
MRSSALATGKKEKNIDAVYVKHFSLQRQLAALGST